MSDEVSERRIGLADIYGTVCEVTVLDDTDDDDAEPSIHLTLSCGASSTRGIATPTAARQIAAALLDAADATREAPA